MKAFIYKPYLSPTLSLTGHCSEKFSPRQKMLLFLILASGASADCGFKEPCPRDGERSLKIEKSVWSSNLQSRLVPLPKWLWYVRPMCKWDPIWNGCKLSWSLVIPTKSIWIWIKDNHFQCPEHTYFNPSGPDAGICDYHCPWTTAPPFTTPSSPLECYDGPWECDSPEISPDTTFPCNTWDNHFKFI